MNTVRAGVCVVGAGYAGLSAARALARAGSDVVVLEARDRVGGRIWTVERDGEHIDIGGAWLGPTQDVAYALVQEYGIETHPTYDTGETVLALGNEIRRYDGLVPKISPIAVASVGLAMTRWNRMAKQVDLAAPWKSKRAAAWDARSAAAWTERNCAPGLGREMADAVVRGLMTCDPAEVSLLHFLYLVRSAGSVETLLNVKGGYQQDLVVGGAGRMAACMAEELGDRVHLAAPVRAIDQDDAGVRVVSDDVEVRADYAVVATPPALATRIEFTPALPPDRAQLLDRMPAGSILKIVVRYADAFWRRDGLSGQTLGINSPIEMTLDAGPPSGTPGVLTAFAFGPRARTLLTNMTEGERRSFVLDELVARLGPKAADPVGFDERDWAAEVWSRGCFMAHLAPGVLTQYGAVLREPSGRIHWAGTETATTSHGAIDGALRSGLRAADEVLSRFAA
jgi:monoamine oxidase